MRAGPLRHFVDVQSVSRATAADGGRTETWATTEQVFASIEPIKGREFFEAQRVQGDVTHRIRLRALSGLTVRNRIKYGERVFNLVSVIDAAERGISHECMATEVVS